MSLSPQQRFAYHRVRHGLSNYSVLRLRDADGALVSMHQSGTHWLKFMLANAMAEHYDIPPPQYNHANDIIGGVKDPVIYNNIPRLLATHTIAPLLLQYPPLLRLARLPPIVLLVRDLRASLVSNYRKWQHRYNLSFSEFLRGDPAGRRFNSDIWWCVRFQNVWGSLAATLGTRVLTLRYEDISIAPATALGEVAAHFDLALSDRAMAHGTEAANKPAMAARADPTRPPGEVNTDSADPLALYTSSDRDWLEAVCATELRYTFAYDYAAW